MHTVNLLLNLFYPEICSLCSGRDLDHKTAPLCGECWGNILPYSGPICLKCGTPAVSELTRICGHCIQHPPVFHSARSYGLYDGTLKKAINLLKYHGIKRLSRPLSDIILTLDMPRVDAVIPVPLHQKRLRQREFNQSSLLARYVARKLHVPLIITSLIKIKDTLPQVGLRSKERLLNINGAFTVRRAEHVSNRKILLIDDVVTTGSTIRECSRTLKEAGATEIFVRSLAHGIFD